MKKYIGIAVCIIVVITKVNAQKKLTWGVEAGTNATEILTTHKSGYSYQGSIKQTPWLGYYLGGYANYKFSNRSALRFFAQGEKRSTKDNVQLTDASGNNLNAAAVTISNNYLNIGALYVFYFGSVMELGAGVNNHILLYSTSYSKDISSDKDRYKNHYFKNYLVSVPVQIAVNLKRFAITYRVDFGVMNRISNSGGFYKEFEYTAQLGLRYTITK